MKTCCCLEGPGSHVATLLAVKSRLAWKTHLLILLVLPNQDYALICIILKCEVTGGSNKTHTRTHKHAQNVLQLFCQTAVWWHSEKKSLLEFLSFSDLNKVIHRFNQYHSVTCQISPHPPSPQPGDLTGLFVSFSVRSQLFLNTFHIFQTGILYYNVYFNGCPAIPLLATLICPLGYSSYHWCGWVGANSSRRDSAVHLHLADKSHWFEHLVTTGLLANVTIPSNG